MRRLYVNNADFLACRLVVVKATKIFAGDEGIAFAVFFAFVLQDGADRGTALLQVGWDDFEMELLLFSAL